MTNETVNRNVWQRFVREGVLDTARLQKRIEESWYLCQRSGVNPYDGKGSDILTPDQLRTRLEKNDRLASIAAPIMDKMITSIRQANTIILLIDKDGYILAARGPDPALKQASKINFIEGSRWTEDVVGTNAVGTALRTGEAITVVGTEHYSVASQHFSCSAAPIHTPDGTLLGVLDITSPVEDSRHEHMLAAVCAASFAVEQQWAAMEKMDEQSLIMTASFYRQHPAPIAAVSASGLVIWMNDTMKEKCQMTLPFPLEDLPDRAWVQDVMRDVFDEPRSYQIGRLVQFSAAKKAPAAPGWINTFHYSGVIGTAEPFQHVLWQAERVAKTDAAVHIHGETGTGKEILARAIHENSSRQNGPFIAVNCGAIPPSLMESELFGYEGGSFTGASRSGRRGKIRDADGGTLFLDEIGDISEQMQISLLRVLQEQEVMPVGASKPVPVNIRIITATHRNLIDLVKKGQLREDLFYRIYVFPLSLPPLRHRLCDLERFIQDYQKRTHWKGMVPASLLHVLKQHSFPGNFRELFNILDRIRILYGDDVPADLSPADCMISFETEDEKQWTSRQEIEREEFMRVLKEAKGHAPTAAKQLGMPRSTFYRKLKQYEMN
ncbi:sigma-54-dependent Fis family transcriptional regulator [Domibacillus sp. PGB-M46]|uniref:sigma-54-dependent Fis family transcriptional regulator n=1 Tax=Domibacillus sp. PGB-M46 TaxID=2910255 RepID=UPI001F572FA7|nr:sigma-54-dependent Fis family transcriptional regulator [Domibacillus sp. PGB-M46]MCI2253023.1 sigma-54-dependent Fis family transcriptional regulator [Domibacillus sp. PGB-M46]